MAQAIIPKDFETLPISAAKVQPTFTDLSGLALLRLVGAAAEEAISSQRMR
jgi:hypothetical protein